MGWGGFAGVSGDNAQHAHHALQICVADTGCTVEDETGRRIDSPVLVVNARATHRLLPSDRPVALWYLDPQTRLARTLMTTRPAAHPVWPLPVAPKRLSLDTILRTPGAPTEALAAALGLTLAPAPADARMADAVAWLHARGGEAITASAAAHAIGLSVSRYLHRLRAYTGLPFRPYVRWLRILLAIEAVLAGTNLTGAAHAAGFADAAHFSRTFRRHFGAAPLTVLGQIQPVGGRSQIVQASGLTHPVR
jgi:AraC-like DNA-binding protein